MIKNNATLRQGIKILDLAKNIPSEQVQKVIASGLLFDLLNANIDTINRDAFREFVGLKKLRAEILTPFLGSESFIIGPTKGNEILEDADFFAYASPQFYKDLGADGGSCPTQEMTVCMYKLMKGVTFSQVLCSFPANVDKLCLTKAQIKCFLVKYQSWCKVLNRRTLFVFKSRGKFFVVEISLAIGDNNRYLDQLDESVSLLDDFSLWARNEHHQYFLVIPQI